MSGKWLVIDHTIKRDLQTPIRFKGHYSSAEVE
jgi:hypothetical protein